MCFPGWRRRTAGEHGRSLGTWQASVGGPAVCLYAWIHLVCATHPVSSDKEKGYTVVQSREMGRCGHEEGRNRTTSRFWQQDDDELPPTETSATK